MIRLRASATTAALIAAVVVMITTAALLQLFYFSRTGNQRDSELTQARWYLEGHIQEIMDGWITGRKAFRLENWNETAHFENMEAELHYQLSPISNSIYRFQASMVWNGRFNLSQIIEFKRLNPFDYTLFFNGGVRIKPKINTGFSGSIGLKGSFLTEAAPEAALCLPSDSQANSILYYQDNKPSLRTALFTNSIADLIKNPESALKTRKNASGIRMEKRNLAIPLPSFEMVWDIFFEHRDPDWLIGEHSDLDKTALINPLSAEKELIGIGDGSSTRFSYPKKTIIPYQIFIKKITSMERYQNIESQNFSYTYGVEQPDRYFDIGPAGIRLKASEEPALWILPDSAYSVLGNFDLAGGEWSLLSQDENLENVYLNRPALITGLKQGVDYRIPSGQKTIQILVPDFAASHSSLIGTGNGSTKKFLCALYPDQQFVYIGKTRTFEYTLRDQVMEFARPPAAGAEIRAFSIPPLYIKKAPPAPKTGVFIDRVENASILDLSSIQNGPESGVILSTTPLILRGNSPVPLVILCTENIYLENMNTGNGSPVMILSKKGVWIFQHDSKKGNVIKQVMIYSPLQKLDTVTLNPLDKPLPSVIIGCGVFTFENTKGVLENSDWYNHWFYDQGLRQAIQQKPFVWMPMPFEILSVRRD